MRTIIGLSVLTLSVLFTNKLHAEDLEQRVQKLESELAEIKSTNERLQNDVKDLGEIAAKNSQNISDLLVSIKSLQSQHEEAIAALQSDVRDNSTKLQNTIVQDSNGQYVLAIQDMKQSSKDFRQQLVRTAETRLYLTNETEMIQTIYVNGQKWRAKTGRSYVPVPFGPVRIRLEGQLESKIYNSWSNGNQPGFKGYFLDYSFPALDPATPPNTVN